MKNKLLAESATSILYHYTSIYSAYKILSSNKFSLSSSVGSNEESKYSVKGKPYFLSTTRSKVGDYHSFVGDSAVMFVLDGNWLNSRYTTKPIDYWERMWNGVSGRTRESEDRIFSSKPFIPLDCVIEVHVLIKEYDERMSPKARQILLTAKTKKIKTYLYDNEQSWRLQDKRKCVSPIQAKNLLQGLEPTYKMYHSSFSLSDELKAWIELIYKKDKKDLSERAQTKLRHLLYYHKFNSDNHGLQNALFNARKPGSSDNKVAITLIGYLQKNKISINQFVDMLHNKWNKIREKEYETK